MHYMYIYIYLIELKMQLHFDKTFGRFFPNHESTLSCDHWQISTPRRSTIMRCTLEDSSEIIDGELSDATVAIFMSIGVEISIRKRT